MSDNEVISMEKVPEYIFSSIESRDVALWVRTLPNGSSEQNTILSMLGLPWRMVFLEVADSNLVKRLEEDSEFNAPLTRKRGFVQIIDSDPTRIDLPQRCLPVYLLNGKDGGNNSDFTSRLRRMTMLDALRRSGVREILVLSDEENVIPESLTDLWSSGFRTFLTFVSGSANARKEISKWLDKWDDTPAANAVLQTPLEVIKDVVGRYTEKYPENRTIIRVRDSRGQLQKIDVTLADEPERPILEFYSLIEERNLAPIIPEELSKEDFVAFFENPESSWLPYAAGLPWVRNVESRKNLRVCLHKLDEVGSEENCVAYIASESGAGGTTLARTLAWECAKEGYPVLLAKPVPFMPDALPVANFLNRIHHQADEESAMPNPDGIREKGGHDKASRRYETPWIIVFDSLHWQYRDSELLRFRNELEKHGRPVCILVVIGTVLPLTFYNTSVFRRVAELNHSLDKNEARSLGHHLNRFLNSYGMGRSDWQWDQFYERHTVRYLEGIAAFWVTLSFWIQGQYDLSESIQEWMYKSFKKNADTRAIRNAILEIAALSSERLPLPEALLPNPEGGWPLSHLLEDRRSGFSALGLVRIKADSERHWALVHDILGRFLINALFYDYQTRDELGFGNASDAEHLRFLILREISRNNAIGERNLRSVGEDFATSIFKIDPDHGRASFASFWREVLAALDSMPQSLRDTSRVFRHHIAISRRRIAKLNETFYGVTTEDKVGLLSAAIEDIRYALEFIEYTQGSESNLNLLNSLAKAYLDLAEVESARGAPRERVSELRSLANETTRKAYDESPTNSHVIETYVTNMLQRAQESPENAIANCLEALGIIFSAVTSTSVSYRNPQLGSLADKALTILFQHSPSGVGASEPQSAIDVLINAWRILAEGGGYQSGLALSDVPEEVREEALDALTHPAAGRGNMQVIRLTLDLTSLNHPHAFKRQLELIEQLQATNYRINPQLSLEYAILLFQVGRADEGDKAFRNLRRLWRESEQFVEIPARLRWLRNEDGKALKTVHAFTGSDSGIRPLARVQEFHNTLVPYRREEHGFREVRPGHRFVCNVSFGHNGPFLRPVTTAMVAE